MLTTNAALLDAPGGSSRRHYAMGNNRLSNHGSANHNPASSSITQGANLSQSFDMGSNKYQIIDPNYKTTLYYNIATCYQRLGMLEECVDYLEMATNSLN